MESKSAPLHVLVGIDGRPSGQEALRSAADLAGRLRAHLDVLYVLDLWDSTGGAAVGAMALAAPLELDDAEAENAADARRRKAEVEEELRGADPDLGWTFHAQTGDPAQALCDLAETVDAYCVVVGSRGEGFVPFLERMLRPSVSHALIHRQHRPVLIVTAPE